MARIPNIYANLRSLKSRLLKLESVKQLLGADIIDIIKSSEIDITETLTAGQRLNLQANFFPSDNFLHLMQTLWSIDVGTRGEIVLNIGYTGGTVTDTKEILTGGNFKLTEQYRRAIVESSNGILLVVYVDISAGSGNYDLLFKTSLDQGATWSSSTKIADLSSTSGDILNYDIFIDSSNHVHVAYDDKSGGFGITKYVKLTFSANSWTVGSLKTVAGGTSSARTSRAGVVVQANGRVFVIYSIYNGTNEGVVSVFTDDGGDTYRNIDLFIGGPGVGPGGIQFNLASQTSSSKYPVLTIRDDKAFALWHDFNTGLMYHSIWTGTQWDSYENGTLGVNPHTSFYNPSGNVTTDWSVTVDASSNIHIAVFDGNTNTIEYLNYNGINWSTEAEIHEGVRDHHVSMSRDSSKQYLFYIYKQTNDGFTRGPLRKRTRTSGTWGTGESVVIDEPKPFIYIHAPFKFRDDNFKYCLAVRGSLAFFGVEDKLILYRETLGGSTSIQLRVAQTSDDGTETNDTSWDDLVVKVGEESGAANSFDMGIRFQGLTIPPGATINSASLVLLGNETSSGESVVSAIKGIKEANTATFSSGSRPSQRSKTTASVAWTIPDRTINVSQTSPDLATIIQEIINQASWVSGNALALVLEDNGNSNKDARFIDYTEQVIRSWYEVAGATVDVFHWKDLVSSNDSIGKRSFWWVIRNLTSDQISIRIRFKGYATWQPSLIRT